MTHPSAINHSSTLSTSSDRMPDIDAKSSHVHARIGADSKTSTTARSALLGGSAFGMARKNFGAQGLRATRAAMQRDAGLGFLSTGPSGHHS